MGWATATAAGLATLLFTVSAWAIPPVLTVQGRLTDNAGQAGEGSYTLTFRLYDADTGDGVIWQEIQPSVDVNGGVFEAPLGANAANPLLPDLFLDNPQVWLGITVEAGPGVPNDGDPELPRQPLTTVGYAFAAQHAEGAGHADTADTAISAGNAATADTAAVAGAVDCNACVGTVQLAFDPATQTELDQALANIQFPTSIDGLSGGTIDGDVTVQGQLSAGSILQGDEQVCDASGNCGGAGVAGDCPEGQAITGINADGSYSCGATGGALPADGLNEISNDLLTNQFVDTFASAGPVPIPDKFPVGTSDIITVEDVGIAQALSVSVNLTNGNLSVVTVKLFDPNGVEYLLFDGDNGGSQLGATYPDPDPTLSGDLTTWLGQNPQGSWSLSVVDNGGIGDQFDGQVNSWSISIQTLSTKKVQVTGDLIVDGNITAGAGGTTIDGDLAVTGDLSLGDGATVDGDVRFTGFLDNLPNSWCPNRPDGVRPANFNGVCSPAIPGQKQFVAGAQICASYQADLCTDSQAWAIRAAGGLPSTTDGHNNHSNWTSSFGDNDSGYWRLSVGNMGDNAGSGEYHYAPCCYDITPPRSTDSVVAGVRMVANYPTEDATFGFAATYCANMHADLCSKAQYRVLRDNGAVDGVVWSNDHSDNDSTSHDKGLGGGADDPQPRDNKAFACCASHRTTRDCPEGFNETGGVCWESVNNGGGSFPTAAADCASRNVQLCTISQSAILRSNNILSANANWTESFSDNDGGNPNVGVGNTSDDPQPGDNHGWACCL